ncbi:MAG: hypothetical protein E6G97_16895 [Alphaproteobacteria bacterium]|nr:MAG: hypothetical protein E6G97_16895 [Alphaproteobacteria bacterium]
MTTRPKKKKARAKKAAKRKLAVGKAAAKKKPKPTKTRGAKSARPPAKRARTNAAPGKGLKRLARRRLALLGASGRRPKSVAQRGPARGRVTARPRLAKSAASAPRVAGVAIRAPLGRRYGEILTAPALRFLSELHRQFEASRARILVARTEPGREALDTTAIRPASEAHTAVADFANLPSWSSRIEAQIRLKDRRSGKFGSPRRDGGEPSSVSKVAAALIVRPRGWHLMEENLTIDGAAMSGALFDFGLYFFHAALAQAASGSKPCLHLPGLDAPGEMQLWHDVFAFAQERFGLPAGTIRASASIDELLEDSSA